MRLLLLRHGAAGEVGAVLVQRREHGRLQRDLVPYVLARSTQPDLVSVEMRVHAVAEIHAAVGVVRIHFGEVPEG